ncbi:ankyrin repeat domain-containing protein [Epidermidibacterium keratini]|uniref:Ankyrin repeat domain-containing protein n=2 Tax=Epidermidibacterium keratini TaxID=1891644 RepID=A0A7L4YT86_9ACTN|nr:ankyrin repeat domain-containing protein [Epidermidibacterium keratini]
MVLSVVGGGARDSSATSAKSASSTPTSPPSSSESARAPTVVDPAADLDQQLRDAAWAGDVATAQQLIAAGADVNAKDSTYQSAYLISTSEGPLELARLMLANGADLSSLDSYDGTGLIRAAERGLALIAGELVQAGIDLDHVNNIGYQAIHEAVWFGADDQPSTDTVRVLVAAGADLDTPSESEGLTPLQMAQQKGYPASAATLTAAQGAPIADPDAALLAAASAGDADGVAVALRSGADIEARDDRERTALLLASTYDRVDVARLLVAMGADPDALDDRHDTPWLVTGVTGSVAMLEALLPAQPDLTIVNRFGGVSVIPASERGHVEYVARVVQTGIDVNHVNEPGWTALLEAVVYGDGSAPYQQIVTILLEAGADPSIADAQGITALQHAQQRGQSEVAAIIESYS